MKKRKLIFNGLEYELKDDDSFEKMCKDQKEKRDSEMVPFTATYKDGTQKTVNIHRECAEKILSLYR